MSSQLDGRYLQAKRIAMAAVDRTGAVREAYIVDAVGSDEELSREVRWMVAVMESSSTAELPLVALPSVDLSGHDAQATTPRQYHVLRRLGEGGMGVVYLAERYDGDFVQLVALKMLNAAGEGSPVLLERFARERQLLARLEHPGIARLVDGGVLAERGPFLAMEYVDGERIDAWCSRHGQGLRERIALFLKVCAAVEYAHRNLVIHRDIKPANILVTEAGEPKLLDFGIAQALDHAEVHAAHERRYLTPRYASPEQVRGDPPTIASDIYALGLLLYALIVDRPPPQGAGTEGGATPWLPSGDAARELPWRRQLTGDLDAIFGRACAFEPMQRYPSVAALVEDVERMGAHHPVKARPLTWTYALSRLLRRRWPVFAVVTVIIAIATGFTWRTVQAEREAVEQAAATERVTDFLVSVFAASDTNANERARHDLTAREVLDAGTARIHRELANDPRVRARLLEAVGNAYRHMDLNNIAVPLLREAADLDLSPQVDQPLAAARCLEALANSLANGEFPAADSERAARQSLQLRQRLLPAGSEDIANAWMVLSLALDSGGKFAEAQAAAQTTYDLLDKLPVPSSRMTAALNNLGMIASHRNDQPAAMAFYERALQMDQRSGETHSGGHVMRLGNYAHAVERSGDFARAIALDQQAVALSTDIYGADGAFTTYYLTSLARVLTSAGRYGEAQSRIDAALANQARLTGEDSLDYGDVLFQLGNVRSALGESASASQALRRVLDGRSRQLPADDLRVARAQARLGSVLLDSGQAGDEVASLLDRAIATYREHQVAGELSDALVEQARLRYLRGDSDGATSLLAQVEAPDAKSGYGSRACAAALRANIARAHGDIATMLRDDEQAWKILHDKLGATHPQTARYGLVWARDLRGAGQAGAADALEKELRPIFDHAFPADSLWRAELAKR